MNKKPREARCFSGVQAALGLDHPISLIISLAAGLVKHFLPKFLDSGGAGWDSCINYTKFNGMDNRVSLFPFLHPDKANAERFAD